MSETGTNPADWRRAIERFEAIGAMEPQEHARALEALANEDPPLHERVMTLFGSGNAAQEAAFLTMPGEDAGRPPDDLAGKRIGPWEVVRELGAGGMGRVWLARRSDGRYEGLVAIKLLKAALAQRGAGERFAREGRILGALAHPRIARLVDAGTLEDGQPYLVLEYVEGERIDDWCDAKRLDLRERVRLFAEVCDAVAYAHANLVVHRDLKPSNILVAATGEVKLLDFGIAKLLDEERGAAEETELTQMAGRALTPEYAAPEQVSGTPVTTATDVYSLGVVLYRLLAGQSPYQRDDGSRPSAFELQRDVLETLPRRLSSATVSGKAAGTIEEIAANRATTPGRLGSALAGDLENIVARALKKSPAERYASAQALRDDLRRYLEYRPVEARGDSAGYLIARFMRRHRVAVAVGALMSVALVAGVAAIAWQAQVARQESVRAQTQADRAKAVSDFMAGIFKANSVDNPDPAKARATTARELLDIGRDRAGKDLAGNPEAHQEVLLLIGKLYYELGLYTEAATLDRERIALLRTLDGGRSARLAKALFNLTGTLVTSGKGIEAAPLVREAREILDAIGDHSSPVRGDVLSMTANVMRYVDPAKVLDAQRETAAFYEKHLPEDPDHPIVLRNLAVTLNDRGLNAEAEGVIAKAVRLGEKAWGPQGRNMAYVYQLSGIVHGTLQHYARSEQDFRRAIEIEERALGAASSLRPILESNLARVSVDGPDWKAAIERLQKVASTMDPAKPTGQRNAAFANGFLAQVLLRAGDVGASREALARALPAMRTTLPKPMLGMMLATGAELELAEGKEAAALVHFRELQALSAGPLATNEIIGERGDEVQARLLLLRGDASGARALLSARRDKISASGKEGEGQGLVHSSILLLLARAEEKAGNPSQAERLARDLLAAIERHPEREWLARVEGEASLRLGSALAAQGNAAAARPHLERAVALLTERQVAASPRLAEARAALKR